MRVQREQRKRTAKRFVLGVLALALVAVLGVAGWAYFTLSAAQHTIKANSKADTRVKQVLTERKANEPFTILLLGNDKRPGETAARADTIIVARIDPNAGKVWMLSIPRDTRVNIPGHGVSKINAANFYGGPSLMIETVQNFLGVPINHYMDINFDGFIKMVDALGGVWVNVDTKIDDPKATDPVTGRGQLINPGYQLLDGYHALTFVRSRDFVDADFTRMKHQQAFFKALADQALKFDKVLKIPGMVTSVAQYLSSDMSTSQLIEVALALKDMGGSNMQTATVTGEWKSPYVWPDEKRKEFLVNAMVTGGSFDATATASVGAPVTPSAVTVAVRNGAGISGCANTAASILRGKGYAVGEVGNANQFVYDETLVVYETNQAAAMQVAAALPKARVVQSRGMYSFTTDVLVVVGKDYKTWSTSTTTTN